MPADRPAPGAGQHFGLVVHQEDKVPRFLAKYVNLILNYHYGLPIRVARNIDRGLLERSRGLRCTFVIQNQKIPTRTAIQALSQQGRIPLFLVFPAALRQHHESLCQGMEKVFFCSWETAFSQNNGSLQPLVATCFEQDGIGNLFTEIDQVPYDIMQLRLKTWLQNLETLPTLPEIVLRIMALVNDPKTTVEDLERLLISDAAIVHKLMQVVNSPAFAGVGRKGEWALKEAIVRLGLKKVGVIAQQIKLINNFVRPEETQFDLRRFWEHSVGCALIADKLYKKKLILLKETLEFSDYWIAALLHDVGKLVLGFFFWEWFDRVLRRLNWTSSSFREAEAQMGDSANHERVGQLLLTAADMGPRLAAAVGRHHTIGNAPGDLTCLIHLADNLCRDLGLGYLAEEQGVYSEEVLRLLGLTPEDVQNLKEAVGNEIVTEVKELVGQCM